MKKRKIAERQRRLDEMKTSHSKITRRMIRHEKKKTILEPNFVGFRLLTLSGSTSFLRKRGYKCLTSYRYSTMMSKRCPDGNGSRIAVFSNPDVEYMGRPTGTVDNDCARTISENMVRGSWGVVIVSSALRLKLC